MKAVNRERCVGSSHQEQSVGAVKNPSAEAIVAGGVASAVSQLP
jgi:hypothetical protein